MSLIGAITNRNRPLPEVGRSGSSLLDGILGRGTGNTTAQLAASQDSSTVFAIIDRICDGVTAPTWELVNPSGRGEVREDDPRIESHAVLDVLDQPNTIDDTDELLSLLTQHWELTGEWNLLVVTTPGRPPLGRMPIQLWPIRPDKLTAVPHRTKVLAGWIYKGPDGEEIPLETWEVIRSRRPHPTNRFRGLSGVESLLTDIDATEMAAAWNRNFFKNSAQPGGIIEFERRLGDVEWREFTKRWREQHQGTSNAHRVATIEGGGKWIDRKYTMNDMQFSQLRDGAREIQREGFGFPQAMLGRESAQSMTGVQAQEVVFGRWILIPRLNRIRDKLNRKLLPLYGSTTRGLRLHYTNPIPPDREADDRHMREKVQAAERLWRIGYHPDDIREVYDLGDIRWVPDADPKRVGGSSDADRESGRSDGADKRADQAHGSLERFTPPAELTRTNGSH